ncbi:HK97 gp10 family phage protein [Bordetella flabilis]|uniref:HK97 gp10 family phage protein n=1 Tax=Bordetella flabilis TaxID=463014 RepID=UPI0009FF7DDA|nr:HK97 gp10 family phage protein [Bordetella flabilis]
MANGTTAKFDTSGWDAALGKLMGPARESLARSMAVAGGQVLRDEAKARAPVAAGTLRDSIYLAFEDGRSTPTVIRYAVSWNSSKAPHGHLVEFGHWRYNRFIDGKPQKSLLGGKTRGNGPQDHGGHGALDDPVWVPAYPFLRPAYTAAQGRAKEAMIERGRQRLPELLRGTASEGRDEL